MKNRLRMIGIIVFIAVIGLSMTVLYLTGCGDDDSSSGGTTGIPPEDKPASERWGSWNAEDSTATITHSVDEDEVCTITVSGTPEPNENGAWYAWKATAYYDYTSKAYTSYSYKFEAWTESETRDLHLQYYQDNDDEVYLGDTVSITTERKTYTLYGQKLPKKGGLFNFQCADKIGTLYIKILEINEYKTVNLTITNFLGTPSLGGTNEEDGRENEYLWGRAKINENLLFYGCGLSPGGIHWIQNHFIGNIVTIPVWKMLTSDEDNLIFTFAPYTGSTTIAIGNLSIINTSGGGKWYEYTNKVPITFTNGNATINFGTQMVVKP